MSDLDLASLAPERLAPLLRTQRYGRSLDLRTETVSTNDDARAAAMEGAPAGHVVLANAQRGGRGSHGRVWSSPAGTDLYVSIVDHVGVPLQQLPPLTLAVGLGVSEAIDQVLPGHDRSAVKWPNDVWVGERKCAGILVEAASTGTRLQSLVIGIGLNVNRRAFPDGLEHPATSLVLAGGQALDRGTVLAQLLERVERWVRRFETEGPEPVVTALNDRLVWRGQSVACGDVTGELLGVAASGGLRVQTVAGEKECVAGRLRLV